MEMVFMNRIALYTYDSTGEYVAAVQRRRRGCLTSAPAGV